MEDHGAMNVFAHSNGGDVAKWQTLQDHCKAVAELSASFASSFVSSKCGWLLGMVHDLGKARASF